MIHKIYNVIVIENGLLTSSHAFYKLEDAQNFFLLQTREHDTNLTNEQLLEDLIYCVDGLEITLNKIKLQ